MVIRPLTMYFGRWGLHPARLVYRASAVSYGASSSTPSKTPSDVKKPPGPPPPPSTSGVSGGSSSGSSASGPGNSPSLRNPSTAATAGSTAKSGAGDAPCPPPPAPEPQKAKVDAPCPSCPSPAAAAAASAASSQPSSPKVMANKKDSPGGSSSSDGGSSNKDGDGAASGACDEEGDVDFHTCGCKALILLNRPKQMNALNHCMARKISFMINKWKCDKNTIVIKGYGYKAFCAGGDVVAIAKDCTGQAGKNFFRDEYKLNAIIGSLKIPYVSLYNGIVMGGGVGLSIHGRYRVATECSMFAMPETQIGFFPDVGVSHFLSRMPNNLGTFLGLTGYRVKGYDLIHMGIATHFCLASKLPDLEKELLSDDNKKSVDDLIQTYHNESIKSLCGGAVPLFTLEGNMPVIMSCFCGDCMEDIMRKLESDPCPLSKEILTILKKCSPLALKVTFRQIRDSCQLDLYDCLNQDFRIASRFMEGKDFFEGVRAMLIDKDKNPKWQHCSVSDVCEEEVCEYFKPLCPEEELNLPQTMDTF